MKKSLIFLFAFMAAASLQVHGRYRIFEDIIYYKKQHGLLSFMADDLSGGRGTGSEGNRMTMLFIRDRFEAYGLMPFEGSYLKPFPADSGLKGVNVTGFVPSRKAGSGYVIVGAHYDHLGQIGDKIYNGADDNASGVTALLNLAEIFGTMYKAGFGPEKNIIFAAFDAKEHNMAGSRHFVSTLGIDRDSIACAINIDQIGTVLEPLDGKDTNFVIMLGENTLRPEDRGKAARCNMLHTGMALSHTYYGSEAFSGIIYRMSDQTAFHEAGIPALLFTSGIHRHTYKTTDDTDIISYPMLKKRTLLIFHLIMSL